VDKADVEFDDYPMEDGPILPPAEPAPAPVSENVAIASDG
jgi:hypothetical protein